MEPLSSISSAFGEFGRPGIVGIVPAIGYMNPAPIEALTSDMLNVYPVGWPFNLGLSDIDKCVLAIHTGSFPHPRSLNNFSRFLDCWFHETSLAP